MDKRLVLLALLHEGPQSGYRLHQIIESHSELYTGLPKPTIYDLLNRMQKDGLLRVTTETGARGPRREKLMYELSASGRREFTRLLREAAADYSRPITSVDVAAVLQRYATPAQAMTALRRRRDAARRRRRRAALQLDSAPGTPGDLLLAIIDAELAWCDRALTRLTGAAPDWA